VVFSTPFPGVLLFLWISSSRSSAGDSTASIRGQGVEAQIRTLSNRAPTLPFMARSSLAVLLLLAALAGVVAARDIVHQDDEDPKFPAAPTILSWYGTLCSRHLPLFSCFLYAVLGPNF